MASVPRRAVDFLYRLEKLIDETDADDYVRLMLHTPATGCLATPLYVWNPVASQLKAGEKNFSLVCLTDEVMEPWFKQFLAGISKDSAIKDMNERIPVGLRASRTIKAVIKDAEAPEALKDQLGLVETSWDNLPGCYYVANKKRAIIVTPFFLPLPDINIFAETVHRRNVEVIGFDTQDHHIVNTVLIEFDTRRRHLIDKKRAI